MTPAETAIREALAEKERAVLVGKVALADLLAELDGERNRSQMYADLVRGVAVVLHGPGWSDTSKLAEEVAALKAERKPLTEAQVDRLYRNLQPSEQADARSAAAFVRLMRVAEAAHGITGD